MSSSTSSAKPQAKIVVYTTDWCPYCVRAKRLLSSRGYAFEEIDVDGDTAKRAWLVQVTGRRTVPQVFIADQPVGGFDDLAALDRAGELDKLVRGSA
jgi:glutaredoxin 3